MRGTSARRMILCILVISILTTVSYTSLAETIDMSKYTDNEIVALLERVQGEIASRGIEKTATIEAGQYVGGKDIPVGSYILICKTDANHHGIVWLSAAADNLEEDYPSKLYEHISFDREESFYIDIEESGILNVPFTAQLRISSGVVFK